ncbi:MAG: hypothetical protein J0I80_02955 [Sphingomonas sp.]|nr:hypothetical protein [Sphingomonas sp.]
MSETHIFPPRPTIRARMQGWRAAFARAVLQPPSETLLFLAPEDVARWLHEAGQMRATRSR